MLDYNNIEVMRLRLITLRVVSVDNTIAVTKITSIYTKIQNVVNAFKNVFQRSSEAFLPDALKVLTIQKYMLQCQWGIKGCTCWLVFS